MTALSFYLKSFIVDKDTVFIFYGLSIVGIVFFYFKMIGNWNKTLAFLLLNMLVYAVASIVYWVSMMEVVYVPAYTLFVMAQNVCHWIITETYLKVSHDAEAILDEKVHEDHPSDSPRSINSTVG